MSDASTRLALVGTYTQETDSEGIYTVGVDNTSGELDIHSTTEAGEDPSFLALHPNGHSCYATNSIVDGRVYAFDVDADTGSLSQRNRQSIDAEGPCHVSVERTGQFVLTANYRGSSVSMVPISDDGSLESVADVVEHEGSGVNSDRQSAPHPHSIVPAPEQDLAYVPDLGTDEVVVYDLDLEDGQLVPNDDLTVAVHDGAGPRHFDIHPDGQTAYLINELDSTVTVFDRMPETGALEAIQTISTLPAGYDDESYCADIHVHPSGKWVYGSNRGHDSIVVFEIESETGQLEPVQYESTRGEWPRNFALSPDGSQLFAENRHTNDIYSYRINSASGQLTPLDHKLTIPEPGCMIFLSE